MACKVGSFTKSTAAATVAQAITGVGFQPRALILFTAGATTDETWADGYRAAIGFAARNAADTLTVGSVASASQDAQATSNASRRAAAKALTIVEWGETTLAECDLTSFDSDGFTLSWTTNNNQAYIIHYMALGGPDLTDAYVKGWDTGTGTNKHSITGVGFAPDCVLHASHNVTGTGSSASAHIGLGAMTSAEQWAVAVRANDAVGTMVTYHGTQNANAFYTQSNVGGDYAKAAYTSMDADGFSITFSVLTASIGVFSLCLKGGSFAVGNFTKTTHAAPYAQDVSTLSFTPEGVFGTSANSDSIGAVTECMLTLGVTDGVSEGSAAITDANAIADSNTGGYSSLGKVLAIPSITTPSIVAAADTTSLDGDGFTLNWPINTNYAAYLFFFAFNGGAIAATGRPIATMFGQNFGFRRGVPLGVRHG
jgi:hypothetical protein